MNTELIILELLAKVDSLSQRVEELTRENKELVAENKELRRRLGLDSSNSSKPPSSDPIFKKPNRPSQKKGKRKPGGQLGHKGSKMNKFEEVDFSKDHHIDTCPHCQKSELKLLDFRIRQVADIPAPKIEVTEHYLYAWQCKCCDKEVYSDKYKELTQEVQYGPRIKSLVSYLNVYQLIPYKRLVGLIEAIYGHKISQGSISNFNSTLSEHLGGFMNQLKSTLAGADQVIHSDETGCMVSKVLHWMHVYSDSSRTLLEGHTKRGREAMDDIDIIGRTKGTVVHDRFSSYAAYDQVKHALCNAHILRDLKSIEEQEIEPKWPGEIKKLLLRAKAYKETDELTMEKAKRLQQQYESILRKDRPYYQKLESELKPKKKGRPKRRPDHNLFNVLWKHRNEILLFIYRKDVPFDNNQAERDLRMLKVKLKISNQFKSLEWMNVHANIRSFISTLQKQNKDILEYLIKAWNNPDDLLHLAGV